MWILFEKSTNYRLSTIRAMLLCAEFRVLGSNIPYCILICFKLLVTKCFIINSLLYLWFLSQQKITDKFPQKVKLVTYYLVKTSRRAGRRHKENSCVFYFWEKLARIIEKLQAGHCKIAVQQLLYNTNSYISSSSYVIVLLIIE